MARYRLDSIAEFARQLAFTPVETRSAQLDSAEHLLHELDPNKAYPLDFVVYRITGYQPKTRGEREWELLTGLALQHDLGLLIEQVSRSLNLCSADSAEPILSIDDVTARFDVTSKTIQRWRRRGLPSRRFIFADGKNRVGFLLSSVERYIAAHGEQGASLTPMSDSERNEIVRRARRLAVEAKCNPAEIARRIARKLHRTPLTILHTLRQHDLRYPESAILPLAASDVDEHRQARIGRAFKRGLSIKSLACRMRLPRAAVYRAIIDHRAVRLSERKVKFIDDPLYHEPNAKEALRQIEAQEPLAAPSNPEDLRVPRDLPPFFRELYRQPPLTPQRERALFLKYNFQKREFVLGRRRLEPQFARRRELDLLDQLLHQATETKNQIIAANLRLVVSVARKHVCAGVSLMELVSEGNIILMRAVESFDVHMGNRFSTYLTLALMKGFARIVPQMRSSIGVSDETISSVADHRLDSSGQRLLDRDQVQHLLSRLNESERHALSVQYELELSPGNQSSVSNRQLRVIQQTAIEKLRATKA